MKSHISRLKSIVIVAIVLLCFSCKNEDVKIIIHEITIKTDGMTYDFKVSKNTLLESFKDSIQYGLLFSDGPNNSIIVKLHRLDYNVNERAKVLTVKNIVVDEDTIPLASSKRLVGSNQQFFEVSYTATERKNQNGWEECGVPNLCCGRNGNGDVVCCGTCDPLPNDCRVCGLMEPDVFPFSNGATSFLTFDNTNDVPTLNQIFRNYNALTIKLK